jgi:hypothetical protein
MSYVGGSNLLGVASGLHPGNAGRLQQQAGFHLAPSLKAPSVNRLPTSGACNCIQQANARTHARTHSQIRTHALAQN